MRRVKAYEIRAADASIEGNRICGAASVMGKADRVNDVIFPGFYDGLLKEFLKSGFVSDGHDWQSFRSIAAMPLVACEKGNQLYTEAEFHSTPEAQATRTVAMERMQHGLSVGLSVGFGMDNDGYVQFADGPACLKYAEANGYDLSLFDVAGLKARKRPCNGLLKGEALYEYGIVPVPAMPDAVAASVKGVGAGDIHTEREFEAWLRDAGYSRKQAAAITLHGWKAVRDLTSADADTDDLQRDAAEEVAIVEPGTAERVIALRARLLRLRFTGAPADEREAVTTG